jgi:glycosyltransferase involved in cell wall biosynthesis
MRALAGLGHDISFGSLGPTDERALEGLPLVASRDLIAAKGLASDVTLTPLQERFRSYWGIDKSAIAAVGRFAEDVRAEAVVLSGLDILPCLGGVKSGVRVWYAGDEWLRHHLSLLHWRQPESWKNVKLAFIKGAYEWAFANAMDRVWVVSDDERRAVERVCRTPLVDVVPNGVDTRHYAPVNDAEKPKSACFWGRLDFEPNIDAVLYFCKEVWPRLREAEPTATFTVFGFQPSSAVEQVCANTPGVSLVPNLPDLRREIGTHAVVVLPFISGGGIKNKLLEAAALARPIVGSAKACEGLSGAAPVITASTADEWVASITQLWRDGAARRSLGDRARAWVMEAHSWESAAASAASGLEQSLLRRAS